MRDDHWRQGDNTMDRHLGGMRGDERHQQDEPRGFFRSGGRDDHEDDRSWSRGSASRGRWPDDHDRERGDRDEMRSGPRRESRFGSDDFNRGVPMDETERLIASNKVEGTPVYDRNGDKLGSIHNFMVDKMKGRVVYAVLKHSSGFLGLGERYYPLEWNQLEYDTRLGGYHVDMIEDDLKSFGSFDSQGRWSSRHSERSRGDRNFDRPNDRMSDRW